MIRAEGTAVPEPSSALLLGFACSGLLLRRRKKQV
ncbi:MAG: PEP-CTERM sorting domain-containing protein [Akkermansiaceae bacterium]